MIYIGYKSNALCAHPAIQLTFFDQDADLDQDLQCDETSNVDTYNVKCRPWYQFQEQNPNSLTLGNLHKLELAQENAKYPVGSTLCSPITKDGQFYAALCKDIKSKQN